MVEAVAAIPMVVLVSRHVGIRDEGLNFLVMHAILGMVLLGVGGLLASGVRPHKAQLLAINLLSVPYVLVAWLSWLTTSCDPGVRGK